MINFFKYPLIYPYKGNIRSTRLLGSNTLPCQSPISIEHVYLILAIRRLRRLLARPTGGSLASLGDTPPPLASLAPHPHAARFARPHPPAARSARPQPPYLKRALQNGLNWPRYIQKMATSGNTLADSNEIGNFRPTSGHSRQYT